MIVLMAGLPGTGKSTVAKWLAQEKAGIVLNKDTIRAALFAPDFVEYSREQDDFVQSVMEQAAESLLASHPELYVFLDGRTFSRSYQIDRVIALAGRLGKPWRIIECIAPEAVVKERLSRHQNHPAKNRDFDLYQRVRDAFEPITREKLVLDTTGPFTSALAYIRRGADPRTIRSSPAS